MPTKYLHNHPEFDYLISIISDQMSIAPVLVEKDYWIMHSLYGLRSQNMRYYLKGGTSLSKGHKIINRFSEDIDILIDPPTNMVVATGKNQNKEIHRQSRRRYYDWMAKHIKIDGISEVTRDKAFDDEKFRSGGLRLIYPTQLEISKDIKNGILLELGFDNVVPNAPITISSWAYDFAAEKVNIMDNRAIDVPCYHPGYTLVEKLQTISTKFRQQQLKDSFSENFMRHYYDVFHLLENTTVSKFIGSQEYHKHKQARFRATDEKNIKQNKAFQMNDSTIFLKYKKQYQMSQALYYKDKPAFEEILNRIREFSEIL